MKTRSPDDSRILYLVPDLFGPPSGIARYCRMVTRALEAGGDAPRIISLLDQPSGIKDARHELKRSHYFPCSGNRKKFLRLALRAALQKPKLILCGHPNFAPLAQVLARLTNAKMVSFIYGIDAWQPLSKIKRQSLNASDLILSISHFTARRAHEVNGIDARKIRILHNCLDPAFAPQNSAASTCSTSVPNLLTVARLSLNEQYKGHDVVIRALPQILPLFPNLVYNIVGDGDGRAKLENLVREIGVAQNVKFHGAVSHDELVRFYRKTSLFVMPSRFEGFGFVFLEAMCYGKAVICGNQDASVEVVKNGETGLTVDPQNPDELARAVNTLLNDQQRMQKMGERGLQVLAEQFSFEKFQATLKSHLEVVR